MNLQRYAGTADYGELAAQAAGNHRKFRSFVWYSRPDDSENWALIYTDNRDSDCLDRANAISIAEALAPFTEDPATVVPESHNHWAVGYVDGFAIRVYHANGMVTDAFRTYCDLQAALADYPILDEELLGRLEQEEIDESWDCWVRHDFAKEVYKAHGVELSADALHTVFHAACEKTGAYPEHTGTEVVVPLHRILPGVTLELLRAHQ